MAPPISGYFDIVFAADGDVTPVPDTVQPDGSISFPQGWGPNYAQDPTVDPGTALFIDRAQTNQLFNYVTSALQYIQQNGCAPFITTAMNGGTPYSYRKGVITSYDAGSGTVNWISAVAANTSIPGADGNWLALPSNVSSIFTGGTSSGSANAQTVTTTQGGFDASVAGAILTFKAGFSNTGAFTLNADADGATAVKKLNGTGLTALTAYDIVVGGEYMIISDGTTLQLVNPTQGGARQKLTTNTTFYVATTGNDSTGLGTAALPWATMQHAYNYIQANVDIAGFSCTISVADGTYAAGVVANAAPTVGGVVTVTGNTTTPTNCVINQTASDCFSAIGTGAEFVIGGGFSLSNTVGNCVSVGENGVINIVGKMNYALVSTTADHIGARTNGLISIGADYTISAGAYDHYGALTGGKIDAGGITVTLSGTPAFVRSFALADTLSLVNAASITYSGAATGQRYSALANSVINTNGAGASYFPGNSGGSTSTGGQYI